MGLLTRRALIRAFTCLVLVAGVSALAASPCVNVDRSLDGQRTRTVAPAIARQLQVKVVDVMESFRAGGWTIYSVNTHETDDAYVFYSGDPLRSRYVTEWGGAATREEEQDIKAWAIKNARGIPRSLAGCFAWHVTKER